MGDRWLNSIDLEKLQPREKQNVEGSCATFNTASQGGSTKNLVQETLSKKPCPRNLVQKNWYKQPCSRNLV